MLHELFIFTSSSKWIEHYTSSFYLGEEKIINREAIIIVRHYLCLVGHDQRELCIHRCVTNKHPVLDCIVLDEVSLAVCYQTSKEDPQGCLRDSVGVVTIVLQDMELMGMVLSIHFTI